MLIFTRWDYVDRGGLQAHHLWRMSPDGRDPRALHGNDPPGTADRPMMEMGFRAVPASRSIVGVAVAHRGQACGSLIRIDPATPDDDRMSQVRRITPDARFPECEVGAGDDWCYATPWPLSEDFYLCAYSPAGRAGKLGIYLADVFGNREPVYADPAISCWSPTPLAPRPRPPMVPAIRPGASPDSGIVAVIDAYRSRVPLPPRTRIAALRIIQVLPKTTPVHHRPQIGYGCETSARAVLGTVRVEADGSAHFAVPAGKGLYFQVLDEDGLAVQSMRSETWVQPGETLVCHGCHDDRTAAPAVRGRPPIALARPPSAIQPEPEGSNPFSFPRLVQPVLDRRCVPCHRKEAGPWTPDLAAGDWRKDEFRWYASYRSLMRYAFHYGAERHGLGDYDAWSGSRGEPGKFGARGSRLHALLEGGHHGVDLPADEMRRITLWLDANSDFFGAYRDIEAQAAGEVVRTTLE